MSSPLEQLPAWASELLAGAPVARLGLIDLDGRPRVQPVTFALLGSMIWSAVDAKPKRVPGAQLARLRFIEREPRVALTVDIYDEDWSALGWVQVLASARIVELGSASADSAAAAALIALADKYPQYRAASPGGPLLSLTPERALCWSARR